MGRGWRIDRGGVAAGRAGVQRPLRLTGRFIVFEPNGLVIRDLTVLREPVLFGRREIVGPAPALADAEALDLTL